MGRFGFAAALISLAVGCNVTAQGTITDGMTGEAIVEWMKIRRKERVEHPVSRRHRERRWQDGAQCSGRCDVYGQRITRGSGWYLYRGRLVLQRYRLLH